MSEIVRQIIDKLALEHRLAKEEWILLIENHRNRELADDLFDRARKIRYAYYGRDVYIRGLIEFSNYCKNNCFYCGIRRENHEISRYRLSEDAILSCCKSGYELGFRTFVLQGGEDAYYSDERIVHLIKSIKTAYPNCAVTLSIGEKSYESYRKFYEAGADRYLLRHETCDASHYRRLHPPELSAEKRQQCLWDLKEIGYQVGTGFMVGSPYQTPEHLAEDMLFIEKLRPHMVGIGPFIPHHATRFSKKPAGTLELTLFMIGLLRLMLPKVLLPATTALSSIDAHGREKGILAGANVIMPNLSPAANRKDYAIYDHKASVGEEAAEGIEKLKRQMDAIGCRIAISRGDSLMNEKTNSMS